MNYYFKNTFLTLLFVTIISTLNAGTNSSTPPDSTVNLIDRATAAYLVDEARALYNEKKIKDALNKFRQASVKDPSSWKASYWIGKCHFAMYNYGYSQKYAEEALILGKNEPNVDPELYFLLAQTYHKLLSLDSAIFYYQKTMESMSKNRSKELFVERALNNCIYAKENNTSDPKIKRERMKDIVSGFDEYNALLAENGKSLYFTARKNNTTGGGMNPDDQQFFEDIYFAQWNEKEQKWDSITNDLGRINSDGFDAISHISEDGLYGLMTLNTTYLDSKKVTKGSDICEIKMSNKGKWSSPKIINNKTINTSFFEGAATMTADGNTMYFISDRKGDKTSTDIYTVSKDGKKWGEAFPLPMNINTTGQETTPFITPDGRYLFFSSDGHLGFGGYDVYVVENQGGVWGDPINLGPGINTVHNDTHFKYYETLKKAYISGIEIIGNKASIDIYEMDMSDFKIPANQ